tara:strand:- start:1709 stop:2173 length:465 start_codon:yes stop_codon:yes gene_type:complete
MARKIRLREANIYGGVFLLPYKGHVTYKFEPGSKDEELLPDGVKPGDRVKVLFKGLYIDNDEVCAIHVNILTDNGQLIETQPNNNRALHVTITSGDFPKQEAGIRLTELLSASTDMELLAKSKFYTVFTNPIERIGYFDIYRSDKRMMDKSRRF